MFCGPALSLTVLFIPQRKRFPELGRNSESVGELWLGLLRFYTEEFDFKEHVISIRQKKLLTTFEKQWTSKCIAIEGRALIWRKLLTPPTQLSVLLVESGERGAVLLVSSLSV